MMCIRGYSSDVADAINLDEKLEATSKLPPKNGLFEKSFAGMYACKIHFNCLFPKIEFQVHYFMYTLLEQLAYPNLPL